jgi:antitoxin ParD1/3/4
MNVSLGKQLEELVEEQVKSGIYQNQSEVVRDALRHMFIHDDSDDTPLLAQHLREARTSPRKPYRLGEFRNRAAQAISLKRRRAKAA